MGCPSNQSECVCCSACYAMAFGAWSRAAPLTQTTRVPFALPTCSRARTTFQPAPMCRIATRCSTTPACRARDGRGFIIPQAPDLASAAPIHVASGQKVQADMVMNPAYRYTRYRAWSSAIRRLTRASLSGAELLGRLRRRRSSLPCRDRAVRNSSACRELSAEGIFASRRTAASIGCSHYCGK